MTKEEFDAMLAAPLPGRANSPSPYELEDEGQAFLNLMGQVGG